MKKEKLEICFSPAIVEKAILIGLRYLDLLPKNDKNMSVRCYRVRNEEIGAVATLSDSE